MEQLDVTTDDAVEFKDITSLIQGRVDASRVQDGLCYVFSPHTTVGLTINERTDPDVRRDMIHALDRVVPWNDPAYRHDEGNSAAHLKASLMGSSVALPIAGGRLALGTWQGIFLCEFDGPRRRHVMVSITPSTHR